MRNARRRLERIERKLGTKMSADQAAVVIVFHCPECGEMVPRAGRGEPCEAHKPLPPAAIYLPDNGRGDG